MGNDDALKQFFIQANKKQKFRMQLLLNPIPMIEATLGIELTDDQKANINEIKDLLVEVNGISDIPGEIKEIVAALEEGSSNRDLQDACVVI